MKKIAIAGNLVLYETSEGRGFIEDSETKVRSPEKEIISLLSASDEWKPVSDIEKQEQTGHFRDALANLEDEVGITVGGKSIEKQKDEPPPSKEGDPETYNTNEAGPQGA